MNISVLRDHKARQEKERAQWGTAWQNTGKVFTKEDGSWLHPETVSETFRRILATTDLPPITLRDLRHVAATLTHGGGGDIHAVKETLRHSTITLTSDTYTSLLPELDREIAEKAAKLIPRSRPAAAEPSAQDAADPQATGTSAHAGPRKRHSARASRSRPGRCVAGQRGFPLPRIGRPCGTRTHNQWIKSPLLCQLS